MAGKKAHSPVSVKSVFYRSCFFLGLGTATVFSYGQVKNWLSEDSIPVVPKAEVFSAVSPVMPIMGIQNQEFQHSGFMPAKLPVVAVAESSVAKVETSPSPAPEAAVAAPAPGEGEVAAVNYEMSPAPMGYSDPFPLGANPDAYVMRTPAQVDGRAENPATPSGMGAGASAQGMMLNSATNNPSLGGANGSGGSGAYQTASESLSAHDIVLLTSGLKGLIPDQVQTVSGLYCSGGVSATSSCTQENHFSIHTSRFTSNEGLASDATFSISGSNAGNLSVNVGLKIQGVSGAYQIYSMSEHLTGVRVHSETRNGHAFRVFEVNVPNLALRANEQLSKVQLKLSFDVSNLNDVQVGADSAISFARRTVQLVPLTWNFTAPSSVASTDPVMFANEIAYSMNIEKLP